MKHKKIDPEKVDALLTEYDDQRLALKLMIDDLEKIKVKVEFFVELLLSGTRIITDTLSPVGLDILGGRL